MKRISRKSLQSEIIENIKSYIDQNKLKSGDMLPSQMEITQLLGISRTSLREALKTLEAYGIVQIVNGKGIYVKDPSTSMILGEIQMEKERENLLEIIEVRKILEKEIIRLVVLNATEEELERVQAILDTVMDKYYRHENATEDDRIFHLELYKICHNKIMVQLAAYVGNIFKRLWENPLDMDKPFIDTMPHHKIMFDHIRKRDFKKAQAVNEKMLNSMIKELQEKT